MSDIDILEAEAAFRDAAAAQRALVIRVDARLEHAAITFSDELSRLSRGAQAYIAAYERLCEARGEPVDLRRLEHLPELAVPEIPQARIDRLRPTLLTLREYANVAELGPFAAPQRNP